MITRQGYIQLIPADGWWAIYKEQDGSFSKSKIAAIALDEDGNLVWLDPDSKGWCEDATETSNFVALVYEGHPSLEKAKW